MADENAINAPVTAAGKALMDDATAGDQRTTLGLGTMATQAASAVNITGGTIGGATTGATQAPADNSTKLATTAYADAAGGGGTVTSVSGTVNRISSTGGATPIIDIDAAYVGQASITTLGTIVTGVWTGTDVAVADGGTGASTAANARTNLGLAIGTNVQAYDAGLNSIAGLTTAANTLIYTTALDTYAVIAAANSSLLVTSGAGLPSLSTAIPNGVTGTTQAPADNSTKVATTAYVDAAAGGGGSGWVLLATATASASAGIEFNSVIDSTYDDYVLSWSGVKFSGSNLLIGIQLSIAATYKTSGYEWSHVGWTNAIKGDASVSDSSMKIYDTVFKTGTATDQNCSGWIKLSDVNGANDKSISGTYVGGSGTGTGGFTVGGIANATTGSTIDGIRMILSSGNFPVGEFLLYGINKVV